MKLSELVDYTGQLLQVERFQDYCPNGLQLEGRPDIQAIVSGVTANMALLERAAELGADLVLVHHGYFWKGEDARVVGIKRKRLKLLLEKDMSLMAYHLPLDAHPELGNNARLANLLGLDIEGWFGDQSIAAHGVLKQPMTLGELGGSITEKLAREPMLVGNPHKSISRVAWCTGAAQDYLELAVTLCVEAFVTGEVSERTVHIARESGVAFIAAGHHATERYGIQALGDHLSQRFGISHHFVDIDNPV